MGQPQFGLLRLKDETACTSPRGTGAVCVGTKVPRMMPWDWTGFVSLDLLILFDPDWTQLRSQQVKAICDWVSNGGTLLLILGQHPLPTGQPAGGLASFPRRRPADVRDPFRCPGGMGSGCRPAGGGARLVALCKTRGSALEEGSRRRTRDTCTGPATRVSDGWPSWDSSHPAWVRNRRGTRRNSGRDRLPPAWMCNRVHHQFRRLPMGVRPGPQAGG